MTSRTPPDRIDGAALLDRLTDTIRRYVILPSPEALDAVALWIAATHAQPAWAHAPRLVIRAPEKRCGKSRLLDVVEGTCHNPLMTVNASPAAVYRSIGSDTPPTVLVDEADTLFGGKNAEANEDLRGLLNAGHQRNRPTIRWDHTSRTVERIETFAMAALAGIGVMPDTIEDRAIVVKMRRRITGETVAPFRHRRDRPRLTHLAEELAAWMADNLAILTDAEPLMPLEDRAADTWEPLIAVADLAAGDWPNRARHAAVTLTSERDASAELSDRLRLLADIRTAFADADALPTSAIIERLRADTESPWSDHGPAGLTPMRLGTMLREYDIRSATIRFGEPTGQAKGYHRADFADAWERYLPAPDPSPVGEPYQPYQPSPPSSTPVRPDDWYGSSRTSKTAVPPLTCDGTTGTAGTATPHLRVVSNGAA